MRILMISTDRKIFEDTSPVRKRMLDYGSVVDELHIVVFSKRASSQEQQIQIAENVWVYPTHSRSRWLYIFDAIRIGKRVIAGGTNWLITTQDPFEAGIVGRTLARNFSLPMQVQIHTDFLRPYFKKQSFLNQVRVVLARFTLPKADCIRVVSKRIKESLIEWGQDYASRTTILPIWIDAKAIRGASPAQPPKQFANIVLWVGRLEPEKDPMLAVNVFAEWAASSGKDAGLVFAGEGSLRRKLEKRAVELGVENRVFFVGWQEDIASWYTIADVLLVTSHYEGYGRHIIEARIAGIPVVAPDVGVAREAGALVAERAPSALVSALSSVLNGKHEESSYTYPYSRKEEYLQAMRQSWEGCA